MLAAELSALELGKLVRITGKKSGSIYEAQHVGVIAQVAHNKVKGYTYVQLLRNIHNKGTNYTQDEIDEIFERGDDSWKAKGFGINWHYDAEVELLEPVTKKERLVLS